MSERGSFVTEYIYCAKCFDAVKGILLSKNKWLCSVVIPTWEEGGGELPIIAGKVGGLHADEELEDFANDYGPKIQKVICHPLRVVVLPEEGDDHVFMFEPNK